MRPDAGINSAQLPQGWLPEMLFECSAVALNSEPPARLRRILVPTDFSECAKRAVAQAGLIGRDWHGRLTLLYVVDLNLDTPPTAPVDAERLKADLWKEGRQQLGQTVMELVGLGVQAETLIREGLPCDEIIEAAHGYDLIVIGRRKPKSIWRLFSRHTVKAVLEGAPCPVVVVPEHDQTAPNTL